MIRLLTAIPLAFVLAGSGFGSCIISSDVDDFEIRLPEKEFRFDTGSPDSAPPAVIVMSQPCVASPVDSCAAMSEDLFCNEDGDCELVDPTVLPTIPCDDTLQCVELLGDSASCNQTDGACQFTQEFELHTRVELANEVPELADLGGSSLTTVQFSYVRMLVLENTLTLATPPVSLYIAPDAVASLYLPDSPLVLDPDVRVVGVIDPIPAATSGQTVDVVLDPDGDAALTEYCRTPEVPFKLFVHAQMTFRAGDPIPQGALTLRIDSAAVVGLN